MAGTLAGRDLLFGLLALQTNLIDQATLVAAFHDWSRDRSRPMSQILRERGALTEGQVGLVAAVMDEHIKRFGDVESSLATLRPPPGLPGSHVLTDGGTDPTLELLSTDFGGGSTAWPRADAGRPGVGRSRFRFLRPHSRGGLGNVSIALDEELHREVALKEIQEHHADDPISRSRFLLEAEVTGALEHPGIVPVYGLGQYDDGRPYYAMRFIKGESLKAEINAFHEADRRGLDAGERALRLQKLLRRFLDVCDAVEYAHSRGVLHRDLKPANIMVGPYGETLVVDWGLAKILGRGESAVEGAEPTLRPPSASGSAETVAGSAIGTPQFMSPEQAAGALDRLGPRSDVYSLGATLYCLLTGRPPIVDADLSRVLERARRGDFPRPRALDRRISPALEAIVLKAMARQPEDRYGSARALAEDLERWLADEPVTAHRDSRGGRLARWSRRHRAWTRAGAAALGLVAATATVALVVIDQARARETKALDAEKHARREAQGNLRQAEDNFKMAHRAVNDYLARVSENTLLKRQDRADLRPLRKQLLGDALAYFRKFVARYGRDATLAVELAEAYSAISLVTREIGSKVEALRFAEQAATIRERLLRERPDDLQRLEEVGFCQDALGGLYRDLGDDDGAARAYARARTIDEQLVARRPDLPRYRSGLALTLSNLGSIQDRAGRWAEALPLHERARTLFEQLVDEVPKMALFRERLVACYNNLGSTHRMLGHTREAITWYKQAVPLLERLVAENPTDTVIRANLSSAYSNLGLMYAMGHDDAAAMQALERTREIMIKLVAEHSSVIEYQRLLATTEGNIGYVHDQANRKALALPYYERARGLLAPLAASYPEFAELIQEFAYANINVGLVRNGLNDPAGALAPLTRGVTIAEEMVAKHPTVAEYKFTLAIALQGLGLTHSLLGQKAEALRAYDRAGTMFEAMPGLDPPSTYRLAGIYAQRAALADAGPLVARKQADTAMTLLRRAIEGGVREAFESDPELTALHGRDDFRLLMQDLAFPVDPFARTDGH